MPEVKFFANIDLGGGKVEGLGSPSAGTDAANKAYVDGAVGSITAASLGAVPTSRTVNGKALSANISLAAADVGAVPTSRTVNGKALSANISLAAADVGAVPTSRTVNGQPLSANVVLDASDVGARADTWMPTASQVGADAAGSASAVQGALDTHEADTSNPHSVTASQVGAVPTTGGTMTGSLTIGNTTIGRSEILDTSSIAIAAPTEILIGVGNTGSLESLGSGFDINADMVHLLSDELFVNGAKITALGNPSVDTDAANKGYVDGAVGSVTASGIGAVPTSRTVNGKALSANISLAAADVGAVPTSRTVNGKALSSNITLSASDVGALSTAGGTLTGNLTGRYLTGTWLQTTAITELSNNYRGVAVIDDSGWVYFRTAAHLMSDMGAASTDYVDSAISAAIGNAIAASY